jgi:hypothetical protein
MAIVGDPVQQTKTRAAKIAVQSALTRVGSRVPKRGIHALNRAVDYLEVGRWMREHGFEPRNRVTWRTQLFDLVIEELAAATRILYLEFGVSSGASMRYWSQALRQPAAMLHGFDSFEGLPEDWNALNPQGAYSTSGGIPQIDDPRVRFFKGWFHETLPGYEWPEHDRLVVNIDADLYSSTKYVLDWVKPRLAVGSYVYFDEFMDRQHELKAFDEFLEATNMTFSLRGATKKLGNVMFQRVA